MNWRDHLTPEQAKRIAVLDRQIQKRGSETKAMLTERRAISEAARKRGVYLASKASPTAGVNQRRGD